MINKETDAILVVDLQNDFVDGSLAVPGAINILPRVKEYVEKFDHRFFSADFHPVNHSSFKQQGGPWPPHCIAGHHGSSFHKILYPFVATIIKKGTEVDKDAYSAFDGTDLLKQLEEKGIKRLFICGLATDYCVKATVIDACQQFKGEVFLLIDAIAAVNINTGDDLAAIQEMTGNGATPVATH